MATNPLTFAQEALGCRRFASWGPCATHGDAWPCFTADALAALIEARDREIRAALPNAAPKETPMADPTPEQRVAEALASSPNGPRLTLPGPVSIAPSFATAALNAVRDALASGDTAVVRAMAERVGLTVSESTNYSAVRRDRPTSHSMSGDHDWRGRIASAIARSDYGMSPDTHVLMCAVRTSASVSTWSPWREVPDA